MDEQRKKKTALPHDDNPFSFKAFSAKTGGPMASTEAEGDIASMSTAAAASAIPSLAKQRSNHNNLSPFPEVEESASEIKKSKKKKPKDDNPFSFFNYVKEGTTQPTIVPGARRKNDDDDDLDIFMDDEVPEVTAPSSKIFAASSNSTTTTTSSSKTSKHSRHSSLSSLPKNSLPSDVKPSTIQSQPPPPPPPSKHPNSIPEDDDDFFSDGETTSQPAKAAAETTLIDELLAELQKERSQRQAAESKAAETERKYRELRQRDEIETKSLEQAMKTIEQALATANQRALAAETQVSKLQMELTSTRLQLQAALNNSNTAPAGGINLMPGSEINQQVNLISQGLDQTIRNARDQIKNLLNGASQLEALSTALQNLGRLTELPQ